MAVKPYLLLFVVTCYVSAIYGRRSGAPDVTEVCKTMKPGHTHNPSTMPPPFTINVNKDEYFQGDTLLVSIVADPQFAFKGFLIQARRADWRYDDMEAIGHFVAEPGTQIICDGRKGNALTHTGGKEGSGTMKREVNLAWTANVPTQGHIRFWVSVVSSYDEFWVAEPSRIIKDRSAEPIPTKYPPPPATMAPSKPIEMKGCGDTKGCYREPSNCQEEACEAVVTWVDRGSTVDFELSGNKAGWVALGFSHDKFMGGDSVVECAFNSKTARVEVRASHNPDDGQYNLLLDETHLGLSRYGGSISDRRIRCRFRRVKALRDEEHFYDLDEEYYLLLATGDVDDEGNKMMHSNEPHKFPMVSPHKVKVSDMEDMSGRARYPLVKAHGCLMVMAWMMSASLAILLARYYKPMWPNDRCCKNRIWFSFHRALMIVTFLLTILAFILIFLHVGGYSKMTELPSKAHPPLGITVTILVILNPLLALCRCKDGHKYRPVFNWIHWFIGTIAFVLQSPTLFIGLSLPKAFVPWWATWVMVAFLLFHVIIELILEIHGCINARKQRQRNLEYELANKNEPKSIDSYETEPVGTRFKSFLISLYIFVMIILGLVMVITIAVC